MSDVHYDTTIGAVHEDGLSRTGKTEPPAAAKKRLGDLRAACPEAMQKSQKDQTVSLENKNGQMDMVTGGLKTVPVDLHFLAVVNDDITLLPKIYDAIKRVKEDKQQPGLERVLKKLKTHHGVIYPIDIIKSQLDEAVRRGALIDEGLDGLPRYKVPGGFRTVRKDLVRSTSEALHNEDTEFIAALGTGLQLTEVSAEGVSVMFRETRDQEKFFEEFSQSLLNESPICRLEPQDREPGSRCFSRHRNKDDQ